MATNPNDSELLTPNQMAKLLGISAGTLAVWRCTNRYPLPYIKIGRSVRYSRPHGAEFIASRTISV